MIGFDGEDGRAGGDEIDAFLRWAAAQANLGAEENDHGTMLVVLAAAVTHLARQNDALAALQEKAVRVIEALERRVAVLEKKSNVRGPFIRREE